MPYIVYDPNAKRVIQGVFETQANADTFATDNGFTAHQGEVVEPAWDKDCEPGWVFLSDNTVQFEQVLDLNDQAQVYKDRIHQCALAYDDQVRYYWKYELGIGTQPYNTTVAWAQAWCGHPWARILAYADEEAGAPSYEELETLIGQAETQLVDVGVREFFRVFDESLWTPYITSRQVRTIDTATGDSGALIATAADAGEWDKWRHDNFLLALIG